MKHDAPLFGSFAVRFGADLFRLQHEPQLAIASIDEWKQIWKRQPYALALLEKSLYRQLESEGFPMRLIANDHSRYYIRTP